MPRCSEIMTPDPVCCEPGDSIGFVAQIMKQEDVGSVPVVDARDSQTRGNRHGPGPGRESPRG